jgi:hypothetical protein
MSVLYYASKGPRYTRMATYREHNRPIREANARLKDSKVANITRRKGLLR